ncbi:hypothetical protein Tco_1264278 [Tanacetum coccineum]
MKHLTLTTSSWYESCAVTLTWDLPALTTLCLSSIKLNDDLFSNYPNLKNLTLICCDLEIRLPEESRKSRLNIYVLSLEKVDLTIIYPDDAQAIVGLLQQIRSVKLFTLNLEIIECLSSSAELISHQPSPFANLKSLKIYPAIKTLYAKFNVSTLSENYFVDSSPSATLKMVLREEIREHKLMEELQGLLNQWKANNDKHSSFGSRGKDKYRGRGYNKGQEAEQKQVKIIEDKRDKVQAEYHVLELQPEGPLFRISVRVLRAIGSLQVTMSDTVTWKLGYSDDALRLDDMSRIGMSMLASKGNVLDVRKVDIYFCKPGGLVKKKNLSFIMSVKTRKLYNANLQFGVTERLSRIFRAQSTGLRAKQPKMLWAYSVSTTYLIYRIPYILIGLGIPEEWRGKDTSLAHLKAAAQMRCDIAFEIRRVTSLTKPIQKSQVVLVDILENLAENDSIVAEHGLSSEITQSPDGSSNTSEGSKNNRSFEDIRRSDKEDSEDGAFSKEGGSETP